MLRKRTIANEMRVLHHSIASLERSLRRFAPMLLNLTVSGRKPEKQGPRRRMSLSREARAALKLQGRYMGYMRQLRPRQKAEVRSIRSKRGVLAAVQAARKLAAG